METTLRFFRSDEHSMSSQNEEPISMNLQQDPQLVTSRRHVDDAECRAAKSEVSHGIAGQQRYFQELRQLA